MDKIKVSRLFYLLVVICCLAAVIWLNSSFFGNPVGKYMASDQIKTYLGANYPDKDFKILETHYNFKTGDYGAKITSDREGITFFINADTESVKYDQYRNEYVRDDKLEEVLAEQVKEYVLPILKKEVDGVTDINIEMNIERGKYLEKAEYFEDVGEPLKIYVDLRSVNTNKISKEEFIEKALKIRDVLLAMDLNVEYLDCYYMYKYKGDGYSMGLNKTEFNLSRQQLLEKDIVVDYETLNKSSFK